MDKESEDKMILEQEFKAVPAPELFECEDIIEEEEGLVEVDCEQQKGD